MPCILAAISGICGFTAEGFTAEKEDRVQSMIRKRGRPFFEKDDAPPKTWGAITIST
jgi:hypothetical protein